MEHNMKSTILIFTLIIASLVAYSQQQSQTGTPPLSVTLSEYMQEDGTSLKSTIPLDTFLNTPEWNGQGAPPLSLVKAVDIAAICAKERYPQFSSFELCKVDLSNQSTDDLQAKRWVYHCSFFASGGTNSIQPGELADVYVLMDGTAVPGPYY